MEVEAQVAHFRPLCTAVLCQWSDSEVRAPLELGQLAGSCPLPCCPRHPLCSPQFLHRQVGISARQPSTTSTATRRPQVEVSATPLRRGSILTPLVVVMSRFFNSSS